MDRSSAEIANLMAEKEQEINIDSKARDSVKLEINAMRRKVHEVQIEIKKLEDALIKAECNVRERKTEQGILRDAFWRARESGV